jgi:flavin-dependent dehydrogenase
MTPVRAQLAVVGASLAGLRAAWAAASAGVDTVLLESRPEVGVPEPLAVVAFDHLMEAQAQVPESCVRTRTRSIRVLSPAGHRLTVEAPARILDRGRLDPLLAGQAQDAGARVLTGTGPLHLAPGGRLAGRSLRVEADVLLFADGARSLARSLLRTMREPSRIVWGAAHRTRSEAAPELEIRVGSHAPGGRTQWTPLGGGAWSHWSFSGQTPGEAIAAARRNLAAEQALRGERAPAEFLGVAPDPVYTLPGDLVGDGILACGGAAGQGGLEMGLVAGEMAGAAAARALLAGRRDAQALRPYEREWRARYLAGYQRLRRATDRLAGLDDARLDRLLEPWDGRSVPIRRLGQLSGSLADRLSAWAYFATRHAGALPRVAATWAGAALQDG